MTKYSYDLKLQIIQLHLDQSLGSKRLGKQFGIHDSIIQNWINLYHHHGADGLRSTHTRYSVEFKASVLSKMRAESWSYKTASAYFGIPSPSTVLTWVRRAQDEGVAGLQRKPWMPKDSPKKPPTMAKSPLEMTEVELREELARLRAENAYLKKLDALAQKKRSAAKKKH